MAIPVTFLAFVVYLLTLAPGITWRNEGADGGDLVAAVATGGVPHPSGYPTYLLLGELFVRLPVGDLAYRLNLMSAAAAAGAVGLTLLVALTSLHDAYPGPQRVTLISVCIAALAFAFSSILWSQAVITEVYALNAFFSALVWYLVLSARSNRGVWRWFLAAGALGVGLGNHLSLAAMVPAAALLMGAWWRREAPACHVPGGGQAASGAEHAPEDARRSTCHTLLIWVTGTLLALLAGLTVYIALPLRAAQQPPVNWGGADTWDGFIWLVTGQAYMPLVAALPLAHLPARLLAATALLVRQAAWWGVPVVYFGVRTMWRRDRPLVVATLLSGTLTVMYAVGYNTSDSFVYLIPTALVLALWIAWGMREALAALGSWVARLTRGKQRLARGAAGCAVVALVALPIAANLRLVDASGDRAAYDYGSEALASVTADAVIITDSGTDAFPLWYFRYAEGRRPDVVVINGHLLFYDWYRQTLRRWHPAVKVVPDEGDPERMIQAFIQGNLTRRPVYVTSTAWTLPPGYRLVADGALYKVESQQG